MVRQLTLLTAALLLVGCGSPRYNEGRALQLARNAGYVDAQVSRVEYPHWVCPYPRHRAGREVDAYAFGNRTSGGLICLTPGEEPRIMPHHGG